MLLALAGCKQEPSFDERFDAAQKTLEAKAKAIDQELSVAASEGSAVAAGESGSPATGE
ncbi:hypothetical protein [Novosphingobium aquae]|uniref:Lipoprotein n=1 Tax=Novosphingobium aquae TaxID=3133435 RepID=A0ABU8SC76_9SPHN